MNIPFQRQRNNPEIQSNRPMVHTPFASRPFINRDEIRETIVQNLIGIENMIDFGNYNEFKEKKEIKENDIIKEEYNMNCFDLDKRILIKGQWVDVKDTVDKWLEAQVIEISEDKKKVKVHYNHWGNRWDEWININSPRIMPFRYHTRQNSLNHYNSPSPNQKPDTGITLLSNINNTINNNDINQEIKNENNFLKKVEENGFVSILNNIEKINKVISGLSKSLLNENDDSDNNINNIKEKQKKFYYDLKRLIPLMNRTGKIYSDISTFFEHAIINNNLDLVNKKLFSDKNNIHDEIKFFSFEERMKTTQEILSKYSERERGNGTLNYVPPMNNFDAKLINHFPIMDTPIMIARRDINISNSFNTTIRNINNNNSNNISKMQIENFNFEFNRNTNNIINIINDKKEINEIDLDKNENDKNNKIIGIKTKRDNIEINDVDNTGENDKNKKKK